MRKSIYQRLVEAIMIDPETGCWEWQRNLSGGYGVMSVGNARKYAHRVSYELAYGAIPVGLVVDHLCVNPPCINPSHLEAVTQRVNMSRGKNARKTHCPKGHEYTRENTRLQKVEGGFRRFCRECGRLRRVGPE